MANGVPQPTQQRPQKPTQVDHILQAHTREGNMDTLYKELKAGGVDVDQFNAEMQAAAKAQESRSWILGSGSLKAMGNGAFMAGYSMWDLFAGRSRFSMRNLGVKPYPLGEDYNTKLGGLVEGATQFLIPFMLSRKGLQSSRIQQLAKN